MINTYYCIDFLGSISHFYGRSKAQRGQRINHLIMSIIINLDVMLAKRKMSLTELSEKVGVTIANLSILKNGKAKAVRFSTLESICEALDCQPGDILEYSNVTNN